MDIFLIIGMIIGLLTIVTGMGLNGTNLMVLLNPEAAIIILIGTSAAVMNSFPKKEFLNIPKVLGALFRENKDVGPSEAISQLVEMSQLSRKNGLLALEPQVSTMSNKFMKKGLSMVIDGTEPAYVREVLEIEINATEERHRLGAQVFTTAGGSSPTLGVLGAVIGLIGALGNLEDTGALGEKIAGAFVATLYGIFFGYVILHPFASRLKRKSLEEINTMYILLEGILALQAGENPKSIQNKLMGMLEPKEQIKMQSELDKES
ncbi:flagellar motor stator protein MotA [Clostridium gasigenes]|uniref:Flagellar motor stator protein MotA n=1 Tax=Clostridium gasigenes TaxID=94869 RepID=A0A7X0V6U8_9CLOT|nr:flagellar motor stator protein MotA [Clostridium gasigenes]MBB6623187.1 flagellar motor stator protein MotA [Clostridium gasigenes]MBB6714964.1 flagellar motor stator protein MotA [Clostridium gasigenes]MBU3087953.1 flagellar motor stator protein MotA [Clostridium gasigenes]MBU3132668.1 flagellar motor stator protein MotA [Clostridium gasigenes]NKF05803.1 flagellar motor stator protein MotA [Clostridium gasigenes]